MGTFRQYSSYKIELKSRKWQSLEVHSELPEELQRLALRVLEVGARLVMVTAVSPTFIPFAKNEYTSYKRAASYRSTSVPK